MMLAFLVMAHGAFLMLQAQNVYTPVVPIPPCILELKLVDAFGAPIHRAENRIDGQAATFQADEPSVLPCGRARLTIYTAGYLPKSVDVDVSARKTLAVEQLEFADFEGGGFVRDVMFGVSGFDKMKSCDLVKAVSLLNPDRRWDSKVSGRGYFGLDGMPLGVYAFVLIGPEGVCATATTVIDGSKKSEVLLNFTPAVTPVPKRSPQP